MVVGTVAGLAALALVAALVVLADDGRPTGTATSAGDRHGRSTALAAPGTAAPRDGSTTAVGADAGPPVASPTFPPATGTTRPSGSPTGRGTTTAAAPPSSRRLQGEAMAPGSAARAGDADGGALARAARVAGPAGVPAGTYAVDARVRSSSLQRVDVQVGGAMVATDAVGSSWTVLRAIAWLDGPNDEVGIAGQGNAVEVDWVSLAPSAPSFTVNGNTILDPTGHPFHARGVNVSFHSQKPDDDGALLLDEPQAPYIEAWGANLVRYTLNQEHWLANCPVRIRGQTSTYRAALAADVAATTSRGMVALLKLATTERGRATGCAPATKPVLKEMADTRSPAFWQSIASTFGGNQLVMFDLFNEPNRIDRSVWRDGGTVTYDDGVLDRGEFRAVGMQKLYDTVRATGATNVVFLGGLGYASDPRVALDSPVDGYGIALSSHVYCQECALGAPRLPSNIDAVNNTAVRARYPLVVTEFGWPDRNDGRYNAAFLRWAAARNVDWVAFGFLPPAELSLLADWQPTMDAGRGVMTKPPAPGGRAVWDALADLRVAKGFRRAAAG